MRNFYQNKLNTALPDEPCNAALLSITRAFTQTKVKKLLLLCTAILWLVLPGKSAPHAVKASPGPFDANGIMYVNQAMANGTGRSWASPIQQLRDALNLARTFPGVKQIWVAKGTYLPTADTDRTQSFDLSLGIAVYGGFSGNETNISSRNIAGNPTILSGDIGLAGDTSDNSYLVVVIIGNKTPVILDGVTVTGANNNSIAPFPIGVSKTPFVPGVAGGLFIATTASPVTLNQLSIAGNYAALGGGFLAYVTNQITLNHCVIANNIASGDTYAAAGGVAMLQTQTTCNDCIFDNNKTQGTGSDVSGGAAVLFQAGAFTCNNCLFNNNQDLVTGGSGGGAIENAGEGTVNLVNCTLNNNTTASTMNPGGNAIVTLKGSTNLLNTIVWSSSSTNVYDNGSTVTYTNSLVKGLGLGSPNLDTNPLFVNAANPVGADGIWGTADDGLRLSASSPARKAGNLTGATLADISGITRGAYPDMGVYQRKLALPTTQAGHLLFANTTTSTTTASWTNGNGSARAVFIVLGSNGAASPVDGINYTANPAFGTGAQVGKTGWYCVYNGTGSSVNLSGLMAGATYRLIVEEYNGKGDSTAYLSTSPLPGTPNYIAGRLSPANVTTMPVNPTTPARLVTFTNITTNSTTASWTNGNGQARVVFIFKGTNGSSIPADGIAYSANTAYAAGDQLGTTGWYCIYNGTGSSVNITGLTAGTPYRVCPVEYNTIAGAQKYLTAGLSPATVTTAQITPTTPARLVTFTNTTDRTTTANWTNGNGEARAVFIFKGADGSSFPVDGISYTPNGVYSVGTQIGSTGWYCIYNGTGSTVNINGLTASTTYRVCPVEYNTIGGVQKYLTTGLSPASVNTLDQNYKSANSLYVNAGSEPSPLVYSLSGEKVEASNILSPNGDGINDIWIVKNLAFYPNNTVTVYDKAGKIVFTKKDYVNNWDGTYRGSKLNGGTYYYLVDLGNGTNIKGFITVVADK